MKGLCLYRSIPDSDVDPQMIVSAPSQLCSQTRCFGQISIEYPVFHGDMCIAVEYSPNMIRGTLGGSSMTPSTHFNFSSKIPGER